jgi:hypothetical protein
VKKYWVIALVALEAVLFFVILSLPIWWPSEARRKLWLYIVSLF